MIVNGVTLPDLPAELLAEYPYAVIGTQTESDGSTSYVFGASVSEFTFVSKELNTQYGADYLLSKGSTYAISYCGKNGSEWIDVTAEVTETFSACVCPCPIVWSNHDIYTAVFSSGSGFVPGTELYYPACQNFNGVWLPKIPADVLASYPNAIITLAKNNTLGTETYAFWASSTEFIYLSQEVFPEAENTLSSLNDFMSAAYDEDGLAWKDESVIPAGTNLLLAVNAGLTTLDIIWSNHDIYEVASVNEETGEFTYGDIYFANSEEPKPTRVSIGRSLVDGYAREVQRLTGTTEQMNAIQIREKLSTVKAGIKIGDVVLPPIPEDVLAEYPYATIIYASSTDDYVLMACDSVFYYATKEVSGISYADGILVGQSGVGTVYSCNADASEWTRDEELNEPFTPIGEMVVGGSVYGVYTLLWANHDICIATTFTSPTEVIIGTEVYFSECQNFNGVWLPKIPEDVLAEYPYALIVNIERVDSDGTESEYLMLFCSTSEVIYAHTDITDFQSVIVAPVGGQSYLGTNNIWSVDEYLDALVFPTDNPMNSGDATFAYTILWSSYDIYEATEFDIGTFEYALGTDLYFPPLPAIDTDRVSIGYDLCDGIAKEIQRLSGSTDKMNALRAYWKLTTVKVS